MPAFGDRIGEGQADELLVYIRSFGPGTTAQDNVGSDNFETRFRQLEEEFADVQQQFWKLTRPNSKRRTARKTRRP